MMKKDIIRIILNYVSATCFYAAAMISFLGSGNKLICVVWLCLGTIWLCIGSIESCRTKNSEKKDEKTLN